MPKETGDPTREGKGMGNPARTLLAALAIATLCGLASMDAPQGAVAAYRRCVEAGGRLKGDA